MGTRAHLSVIRGSSARRRHGVDVVEERPLSKLQRKLAADIDEILKQSNIRLGPSPEEYWADRPAVIEIEHPVHPIRFEHIEPDSSGPGLGYALFIAACFTAAVSMLIWVVR